jgi:Transglutaminase-like superfamily
MSMRWCRAGVVGMLTALAAAPAMGQSRTTEPPKKAAQDQDLTATVHGQVESVLKVLGDGGDFGKASGQLRVLFQGLAAYAPAPDGAAFADADSALRMVEQLATAEDGTRKTLLAFLRAHPSVAGELAMSATAEDDIHAAYAVLERLIEKDPQHAAAFPALTAALCLVYDQPHTAMASRRPGQKPEAIDPVEVFGYFVSNMSRMEFDTGSLPPQVVVYLVETEAVVPELAWALKDHAGERNVGKRYFDLTYDTPAFKYNQPKRIAGLPYTLENLRRVGGVCEEQAYYAAHVARAIGVPATMISGRSADVAHVWVGFLQDRGGAPAWNMNEGHYDEYEKLRGTVIDPQTGRAISDDALALTADLCGVPAARRHAALALAHAGALLLRNPGKDWPPPPETWAHGRAARKAGSPGAMELFQASQDLIPCLPEAWAGVRAGAAGLDTKSRQAWFERLGTTCGRKYPSFAYGVLASIIGGIADPRAQSDAWDWAFNQYRQRADLAGDARLRQARMWDKAADKARAYEAYVDVARTFPNDGTAAVEALADAEKMLRAAGKDTAVIDMYADAWRRIARPSNTSAGAFAGSNYFRVGERYAAALERAGRAGEAGNVRRMIERGIEKEK